MTRAQVLQAIQDSFDSLLNAELISSSVRVQDDTVLLGPASILDSIAFVTFMVELEERLQQASGREMSVFSLAIDEIHEFNPDEAVLTAGTLADYVEKTALGND